MSRSRLRLKVVLAGVGIMSGALLGDRDVVAAAQPDGADELPPDARASYDEGLAQYRAKNFPAAIAALEKAHGLAPKPEILFALAQAVRLSGDCPRAITLFDQFLLTSPPEQQIQAANIARKLCTDRLAATPPPPVTPPPNPDVAGKEPTVTVPALVEKIPPRPMDTVSRALIFAGAGTLVAGGALLFWGHAMNPEQDARTQIGAIYDQRPTAELLVGIGIATLAAGGTLVATGLGRYAWFQPAPTLQGAQIGLRGRF